MEMITETDSEKDTDTDAGTDMEMESGTFAKNFIWCNTVSIALYGLPITYVAY